MCPNLTGTYRSRATSGADLGRVFGLDGAGATLELVSSAQQLHVTSGALHRTLVLGADFECSDAGLTLTREESGGYEIPGVLTEHVNRRYTFSKASDGALIAHTTDKERVKFIGPELTGRASEGPEIRWTRIAR